MCSYFYGSSYKTSGLTINTLLRLRHDLLRVDPHKRYNSYGDRGNHFACLDSF